MSDPSGVYVALRVEATPEVAFDAFTREIAAWWRELLGSLGDRVAPGSTQ